VKVTLGQQEKEHNLAIRELNKKKYQKVLDNKTTLIYYNLIKEKQGVSKT
jgi:hypothetical protein